MKSEYYLATIISQYRKVIDDIYDRKKPNYNHYIKETLKAGWQAMFLPVIILLPFVLDAVFADNFFVARLGAEGAG